LPSNHSSSVFDLPDNPGMEPSFYIKNTSAKFGLPWQKIYINVSENNNSFFTVLRGSRHFLTGFLNTMTKRIIIGNVSYFLNTMSYIVMTEEVL
jgi:hypothetical protein